MILWNTYYISMWSQKQSRASMEWGVTGSESIEQDRPQFVGMLINSPINGQPETYFSDSSRKLRQIFAYVSQLSFINCLLT